MFKKIATITYNKRSLLILRNNNQILKKADINLSFKITITQVSP